MKYNARLWGDRMWSRSDMSIYLTHLTRKNEDMKAHEVLTKILNDKKILGSTNDGFIKGSDRAVCFQDAPLQGIAQNLRHEIRNREKLGNKTRYSATGLMFNKPYAFKKKARPVIYDTKEYGERVDNEDKWRVVTLDLNNSKEFVDWTHEREWRVKGDFEFEYSQTTVLLPGKEAYREFVKNIDDEILGSIQGIVNLNSVIG